VDGVISIIRTSLSGLEVSARTVEASASNVANVRTAGRIAEANGDSGSATGQVPASVDGGYRPVRVHQEAVRHGGARATLADIDPPHAAAYDPANPLANEAGLVALPRVEVDTELVNMIRARRAYEANLEVLRTGDRTTGSLLDTIR
jgi:flagellar basal-body rod protein FlgC